MIEFMVDILSSYQILRILVGVAALLGFGVSLITLLTLGTEPQSLTRRFIHSSALLGLAFVCGWLTVCAMTASSRAGERQQREASQQIEREVRIYENKLQAAGCSFRARNAYLRIATTYMSTDRQYPHGPHGAYQETRTRHCR